MRRDLGRVAIGVVTALCAVLSTGTASAQDALLVGGRFYSASRHFGQDLGPAPAVNQQDIFGGQRYAVVNGEVVDARTGAGVEVFGNILAVDRARPRVFVRRETGMWLVDVSTGAEFPLLLGDGTLVHHCDLAYSVNVLFCGVWRNDGMTDVVTVDIATLHASAIAAIPFAPAGTFGNDAVWIVTSDGRRRAP